MRQRYVGPERPGTEYARSIARYSSRGRRRAVSSYLNHPLVPAIALGLLAAGVALLWPRQAHGRRAHEAAAREPSRRQRVSASGLATGLQSGGVNPGHSPAVGAGAIGTGGGSTAHEDTGALR